jgi:DNA helicase-2/ATP-dependent DNA helicase PcrA
MSRLTLAVAGGRKTQSIIDECCAAASGERILILTYTQANQHELIDRLSRTGPQACSVAVQGWFSFLLSHWIRPYLPLHFANRRLRGLNFEGDPGTYVTGERRFLDDGCRAYRRHLAHLAFDVNAAADGAPLDRLRRLYDVVYIDEVQDLNGWDLEILDALMGSPIALRMVGDVRQAIFFTNARDPKNSQYKGAKVVDWFRKHEKAGRIRINHASTTWRSNQVIADLADSVIDPSWGFPPTTSEAANVSTSHVGVLQVRVADAEAYERAFGPLCLRSKVTFGNQCALPYVNIGQAKGMEAIHVLIWPTRPMIQCLRGGARLAPLSASELYVAITRARASVAFITDEDAGLTTWGPAGQ